MNSTSAIAAPNAGRVGAAAPRFSGQLRREDPILIPARAVLDQIPERDFNSFRDIVIGASIGALFGLFGGTVLVYLFVHFDEIFK